MNDSLDPTEQGSTPPPVFAELGRIVHGDAPMSAVLRRVVELAKEVIPELSDASVTLIEDARARTVVFTGPLAVHLDERQYEDGFGPCTDAAVTGSTIIVDTSRPTEGAYPGFARVSAASGVTHTLSVGLPLRQRVVGALNMYSKAGKPFSDDSVALAETFATYAAVAVANIALYETTAERAQQMENAMRSRAVIEQAKGIVMARQHCSADDAFAVLQRLSMNRNQPLRELAAQLVALTHARPGPG